VRFLTLPPFECAFEPLKCAFKPSSLRSFVNLLFSKFSGLSEKQKFFCVYFSL
jgi:hypothetical protein